MNIRIGVIGPEDSVKQVLTVSKEFTDVEFIPFVYEDVYQVDELIMENPIPIDQWLFTGVLNYTYATEKKLVNKMNATFPPLYGSSFFATLLEAQLAEEKVFKKISIDTLADVEVEKILSFYQLDAIQYTNFPFSDYTYIHKLADFHEQAYQQGTADVAITSTSYAYTQLKEKGIPVYRMNPSYLSIQLSIELLIERAHANRFKRAQIAIIGASVDFHEDQDNVYYMYKMKQDELDIRKEVLFLAEKVSGSFISTGDGSYLIYTNRGEIDGDAERYMIDLSKKVDATHELKVHFSIGYGETASQAEQHVKLGLKQFRNDHTIVIVDESKHVTIKKDDELENALQFPTVIIGKEWEKKIKESGVSYSVISKIVSLANHYHRTEFSSQDISGWLKSSERKSVV